MSLSLRVQRVLGNQSLKSSKGQGSGPVRRRAIDEMEPCMLGRDKTTVWSGRGKTSLARIWVPPRSPLSLMSATQEAGMQTLPYFLIHGCS